MPTTSSARNARVGAQGGNTAEGWGTVTGGNGSSGPPVVRWDVLLRDFYDEQRKQKDEFNKKYGVGDHSLPKLIAEASKAAAAAAAARRKLRVPTSPSRKPAPSSPKTFAAAGGSGSHVSPSKPVVGLPQAPVSPRTPAAKAAETTSSQEGKPVPVSAAAAAPQKAAERNGGSQALPKAPATAPPQRTTRLSPRPPPSASGVATAARRELRATPAPPGQPTPRHRSPPSTARSAEALDIERLVERLYYDDIAHRADARQELVHRYVPEDPPVVLQDTVVDVMVERLARPRPHSPPLPPLHAVVGSRRLQPDELEGVATRLFARDFYTAREAKYSPKWLKPLQTNVGKPLSVEELDHLVKRLVPHGHQEAEEPSSPLQEISNQEALVTS
eukprot:TRINITY_DN4448_c0_g1_i1.p1 TRINITY_DN4448_c0_g1~~TRINITY_DN4448_c0_g1_i1.p1  ORF type:complete len:388 (+),score=76.62 TRINITY_DN4448_c0_g1_i1:152-1315(+)